MNGTQQLLVYADDINLLDKHISTINKKTDLASVTGKIVELEENAGKTEPYTRECLINRL